MTYFLKKKKWMAWVVLLTFLFTSFMPSNLLAGNSVAEAATLSQIANGQDYRKVNYYKGEGLGQEAKLIDGANAKDFQASTSKTIMPTDVENEFDITLQVMTTETLSSYEVPQDAAVVIVLDTSYSMLYRENGIGIATINNDGSYSSDVPENEQRLTRAVNAINTFISNYKANMSGAAYLSVLTFNKNANVVKNWFDLKKDTNYYTLQRPKAYAYTNIKAGLDLATEQLGSSTISDVKNKYVILVSDGKPTAGDKDGNHKTAAKNAATALRQNATLYTISYGSEGPTEWLASNIATPGCAFEAKNSDNLTIALGKIYEHIKLLSSAWQVSDKMGEHINFLGFYNREGGYIANSTSVSVGGKDICTFANNQIDWNLRITPIDKGSKDSYSYTLKYRVRLDNTFNSFAENSTFDTNGATTLVYAIKDQADKLTAGPFTVNFDVPAVKGLLGKVDGKTDISFVKVDADDETPLANAQFELKLADSDITDHVNSHTADSAYMEGVTKTSSEDGKFSFSNIPSGHTYTLTETKTPDGYQPDATWTVEVNYGEVIVTDKMDATATPIVSKAGVITIVNHPNTGNITFSKVNAGSSTLIAGAEFGLYTKVDDQYVAYPSETEPLKATSGGDGIVTFTDIPYGTYYVQEIKAPDGYLQNPAYYEVSVNGATNSVNNGNVPNIEKTSVTVKKVWEDNNDQDGIRPESVKVKLYAEATGLTRDTFADTLLLQPISPIGSPTKIAVKEITLSKDSSWKVTESNLPKTTLGGELITYSVEEVKVPTDYQASYSTEQGTNALVITNTHTPATTSLTVKKVWVGGDSDNTSISFKLYKQVGNEKPVLVKNGGEETYTITKEVDSTDTWGSFTISNLPVYEKGQAITYTVQEVTDRLTKPVNSDYTVSYSSPYTAATMKDGAVSIANSGEITITNILTGKADITVRKVWEDGNNQDGKRANITVQLQSKVDAGEWAVATDLPDYQDGEENVEQAATKILATNANDSTAHDQNLTYTWHDVPLYDASGNAISYRVVETKIGNEVVSAENKTTDYTVTYSDNNSGITPNTTSTNRTVTITNTHTPETVKLQVEKTWVGDKTDNMDLTFNRPDTLTFTITGKIGETKVSDDTVTMTVDDAVNTKTIDVKKTVGETLVDLPKYSNGQLITYTVTEDVPEGYTVDYTGDSQNWTWQQPSALAALFSSNTENAVDHVFKVTNTLKIDGAFEFTKLYNGSQERGSGAQFTVKAVVPSGNGIADKKISGQNDAYTISGLKYGVIYKVEETTVPTGYTAAAPFYLKYERADNADVVKAYHTYTNDVLSDEVTNLTTENPTANTGLYLDDTGYKLMNFVKTADFSFTKEFDNGATFDKSEMPTFNVTDTRGRSVAVTLDDGRKETLENVKPNADKQYIFNNLEYGAYQVIENNINGYEPVSFWITVDDDASGHSVATVEANSGEILPVADVNGHYTLTNIAKTTSLTLSKTYNGIDTGDATFTITEKDEENPMAHIDLKDDLYTFSGLQYGKTYTVVENAPTGYVGVKFTIDVTKTDGNGDPIAEIKEDFNGLTKGSQGAGYDYALVNKVKTTGFSFNKVFEKNRNTTTPSFVAYKKTKDGQGVSQFEFAYQNNDDNSYQYSIADGLEYGRTYVVMEKNTPAGYETADPFEITIDLDKYGNAVANVTKSGKDFKEGVLTNHLKDAEYEIHYHYQQLDGKYLEDEQRPVDVVSAKVGDKANLLDDFKDVKITTSSVYVFGDTDATDDTIVVENINDAKTILNVYFDLRFAVQYHWKDADEQIHDDSTINEPKYDLTLNDLVSISENKAPNTDATPDNPWYLFNGQWYATTQQAFDWNFDNAHQWLLEEDQVDKDNILTYVKDNILHLYAAWNAKPAAAGNINVSKTVKIVNEKEGNTDRDKLFDFALDLYVTTGSGLSFEQAKANITSPSAIDFKITITDKDGKTVDRVATLKDDGNGHYQYLFQLKDGENASFDLKAVASTGSALIWFQLDETSAGEDVGFTTELTGEESTVSGLSGIGCVDENGVYTFGYVNTFTYEADRPTDPEDPTDPERPRDPSDPREPDEPIDIKDPDVPLTEPDIEIEDPDVPLTDVPGEPIEIDEPEVPLGDAPKTGDSSNAIPFVVLMMVGITGLAITRRKFN